MVTSKKLSPLLSVTGNGFQDLLFMFYPKWLAGLNWSANNTLTLRWSDTDHTGSDGLYALDNFSIRNSITSVPEPAGAGTLALGLGALALFHRLSSRRRSTRP